MSIIMRKKVFLLWIIILLLGLTGTAMAASVQPQRVAILPVVAGDSLPRDLDRDLYRVEQRHFHVPLNGILQAVELVEPERCVSAMPEFSRPEELKGKLPELARSLQADMVIVMVVENYTDRSYYNFWQSEWYSQLWVSLRLIGYDGRTGKFLDQTARRSYDQETSTTVTAPGMARDAAEELLKKIPRSSGGFSF